MDSFPATKSVQIPCRSTYEICTAAHRILEPRILKSTFEFNETVSIIISEIFPESLFPSTNFICHSNPNHKEFLIKYIVESYISIRATQIARKISIDCQFKRSESRKERENQKEKAKQIQTQKPTQKQKKIAHFQSR